MKKKMSTFAIAGTTALALAAIAPQPALASATYLPQTLGSAQGATNVVDVQWRGHRHHHRGHWRGGGGALALGIGSAIIGGAIASQYYGAPYAYGYGGPYAYGAPYGYVAPGPAYAGGGWEACRAQFRSLRADGTYTTYDGRQVMCPYL